IVIQLLARGFQFVPFCEDRFNARVLAHDFAGPLAIIEKPWVGNFALEFLEPFTFALNERLKVHCGSGPESVRGRNRSPKRTLCSANLFCPGARPWCCRSA